MLERRERVRQVVQCRRQCAGREVRSGSVWLAHRESGMLACRGKGKQDVRQLEREGVRLEQREGVRQEESERADGRDEPEEATGIRRWRGVAT